MFIPDETNHRTFARSLQTILQEGQAQTMKSIPSHLLRSALIALMLVPAVSAQQWVQAGPAPANNGQPENITNSPVSGATEAVVAHPSNASILWVGTVNGGIFRTNNATAASPTWTAQTDTASSMSIGDLALDPTDGTFNTLVAGIGKVSSYTSDGGSRAGLLRTTNGGTSWTLLSSLAGANVTGVVARGSTIVASVNAFDGTSLCSNVGIYRSTNTGGSFTLMTNNAGVTGLPCALSQDLAGDPTDNSRLFASVTGGGTSEGIYRSTNTGSTWGRISSAAMNALLATPSKVEIAVGQAGGTNANVFVAICAGGSLSGLFHSANGGAASPTWSSLDLPMTTELGTAYGTHPGGQCGIHLSLEADPNDDDVVYIGGDRQPANNENGMAGAQFPNSIAASQYGGRLFKVDAGQSPGSQATPITNCPSASAACGGAIRTVNDTAPHADSRDMAFDANGDLLQTDDGGIYKHTDPSGSSGDWVSVIGDLSAVEQHSMDYDSVSNILISGNQDNGTTQQQSTGNATWTTTFGGDGGDVAVAEADPIGGQSTRYQSAQNFGSGNRVVYNSSNVAQSQVFPNLTPLGGAPSPSAQFVLPLAVNAVTPSRVLFGAGNGVYESFDRLDSVSRITTVAANGFFAGGTMAYGAIGNANAVYVASGDRVHVRTAAPPAAVTNTDPDGGTTSTILAVLIDPDNAATAFSADFNSIFRTTNSGAGWSNITGNLQSFGPGTIRSLTYINSGGDQLVAGTDRGVFAATAASGFSTWAELGTGIPHAPVFDLRYDLADELLLAGTLGRGTWSLDVSGGPGGGCSPDDSFEDDDNAGQASSISSGVTQAHKVCPIGDEDWVTFTLAAESEVVLQTSGLGGDTVLTLYQSNGTTQIEQNDDFTGLFSRIDRVCGVDALPAGTYLAKVEEFNNNETIDAYDLDYTLVQACGGGGGCASAVDLQQYRSEHSAEPHR